MEESTINAPHVDEDAEAAAFFGGDDPGPEPEVEAIVPDDPGPSDTRSDLQKAEDSYQYKVSHGEAVSPELQAAHDAYEAEAAAPSPDDTQAKLRAIAEREAAERAAAAAAPQTDTTEDPTPPAESAGPSEPEPADTSSGPQEREYIVFQKVPMTEAVLKHLLTQIEEGNAPEPRVAYFELHRAVTRNDKQAAAAAYDANKTSLGDKCDLASVSSRSFKERHVEIKPVTETALSIT